MERSPRADAKPSALGMLTTAAATRDSNIAATAASPTKRATIVEAAETLPASPHVFTIPAPVLPSLHSATATSFLSDTRPPQLGSQRQPQGSNWRPSVLKSPRSPRQPQSPVSSRLPRWPAPHAVPVSSLISCVIKDPPLPIRDILALGGQRRNVVETTDPPATPSLTVPELPDLAGPKGHQTRDALQQRSALWGDFQEDMRYRVLHRNDPPPPPPPPPPPHKSMRGPKVKTKARPKPPEPSDWTGKVALALHQILKKQHGRVHDVFKKFDTDGSGSLDAQGQSPVTLPARSS